jgi:hypothetical protein
VNPSPDGSKELHDVPTVLPREPVQRWRLVLARRPVGPEAAQREQLAAWESALAASGLPLAGLDAPRSRPRFAVAAPLAAAIPGEGELLDLWLTERCPVWRVREALLARMPAGWRLVDLYDVWLGEPALPGRVVASVYRAEIEPGAAAVPVLRAAAARLLEAETLTRERPKGETKVAYDLRPFIDALEIRDADGVTLVRMTLRHDPEKGVGRPEELLAALGEAAGLGPLAASVVRERLVLAEPPPPTAPVPRRRPGTGTGPRAGRAAGASSGTSPR